MAKITQNIENSLTVKTKLNTLEKIIAKILVDKAMTKSSITYTDLCKELEKGYGLTVNAHLGFKTTRQYLYTM